MIMSYRNEVGVSIELYKWHISRDVCVEGIFSSYHLSLITWKQFASRIWKLKKCCENIIMSTIMYCIRSNIIMVKMCKILLQLTCLNYSIH